MKQEDQLAIFMISVYFVYVVHRARSLLTKGKNGTNNCFTTISLGKEKYQTSLKENASSNVEWHEECELYNI